MTERMRSQIQVAKIRTNPIWASEKMHPGSLWKFSEPSQIDGEPGADPEHAGGIIYTIWPQEELNDTAGERDIRVFLVTLLSLRPRPG